MYFILPLNFICFTYLSMLTILLVLYVVNLQKAWKFDLSLIFEKKKNKLTILYKV